MDADGRIFPGGGLLLEGALIKRVLTRQEALEPQRAGTTVVDASRLIAIYVCVYLARLSKIPSIRIECDALNPIRHDARTGI